MIVTCAALKGGTGKTTTAAHMLVALHQAGHYVVGIDADAQGSLLTRAESAASGDAGSWPQVIAAPSTRVGEQAHRHADAGAHVIIDTPNDPSRGQAIVTAAMRAADVVLVPVAPTPEEFVRLGATLDLVEASGRPAALLLVRVRASTTAAAAGPDVLADIAAQRGARVLDAVVPLREAIAQAYGSGLPHPAYLAPTAELFGVTLERTSP